ncbi:MAG: hypothetical protein ACHQ49_15020 [Elusimicrobiota bacterium]
MNTLLLLHSVKEAEYCVRRRLHEGCLLLSTDPAVDVHLRETRGIECRSLSEFLNHEELSSFRAKAATTVDRLLFALDEGVAPALNRELGLKMRYFVPLYSYYGKHYLLGQIAFVEALRKVVDAQHPLKIRLCRSPYQSFLNVDADLKSLIGLFLGPVDVEMIDVVVPLGNRLGAIARLRRFLVTRGNGPRIRRALTAIAQGLRFKRRGGGRKTILLAEPLYFLDFLRDALSRYDLLCCGPDGYPEELRARDRIAGPAISREIIDSLARTQPEGPLDEIFLKAVRQDFTRGISGYLGPVLTLKKIQETRPISLGIWGNIGGFGKYMIFEYLRSEGVSVVGTQHGNSYVDQVAPMIFDSDFSRCDHFVSWGFDKEDLARAFPRARAEMEVHPVGRVAPAPAAKGRPIDVLYPLCLGLSLFEGGAARTKPDALLDRQIRILRYLDTLKGRSIYVKTFPFLPADRCAVWPILKGLKNVRVAEDLYLDDFLQKYAPRAVVIDYPASPLFQTAPLDSEIFMLPDELNPYEARALKELEKRVHYCADAEMLIDRLDSYFSGRLERRRDDTYLRHYQQKPNSRENTVRLIEDLAG